MNVKIDKGYPNHYTMKLNRLEKLKSQHCRCEVCKQPANSIHHLDETRDNHSLNNLIVVCTKCHGILHKKDKSQESKGSKFQRLYGITLAEMVQRWGKTESFYSQLHARGKLEKHIKIKLIDEVCEERKLPF